MAKRKKKQLDQIYELTRRLVLTDKGSNQFKKIFDDAVAQAPNPIEWLEDLEFLINQLKFSWPYDAIHPFPFEDQKEKLDRILDLIDEEWSKPIEELTQKQLVILITIGQDVGEIESFNQSGKTRKGMFEQFARKFPRKDGQRSPAALQQAFNATQKPKIWSKSDLEAVVAYLNANPGSYKKTLEEAKKRLAKKANW